MNEFKDVAKKSIEESKEDAKILWTYIKDFGIIPVWKWLSELAAKTLFAIILTLGAVGVVVSHLLLFGDEYLKFCEKISKYNVTFTPKD